MAGQQPDTKLVGDPDDIKVDCDPSTAIPRDKSVISLGDNAWWQYQCPPSRAGAAILH